MQNQHPDEEVIFVLAKNKSHPILSKQYWHLVGGQKFLLHNAYLSEGLVQTASFLAEVDPSSSGITTPYHALNSHQDKEEFWDNIRVSYYPELPTRHRALFLFDSYDLAVEAQNTWFKDNNRQIVEARIHCDTRHHRADASWLNCLEKDWEKAAHSYWKGKETTKSKWEIIVYGLIYFPHLITYKNSLLNNRNSLM